MPEEQFLYLDTTGWKTGRKHRIEIWFVQYLEKYYVMSEGKERAHWVQNIVHNPKVSFSVSGRSSAGTAKVIEKGPVAAEVKKLMKAKYGWNSGLIVELAAVA
ncbi:MAG TPA: nitroreductase/quinone reductase family protein [Nitrososphaera sp.]|nr:nitroreductase/quinone reductase family protein [Nitrososphaera sp.]